MTRQKTAYQIVKGESHAGILAHDYGYKTACTCAVLAFFGIDKSSFKFCQWVEDMVRQLNKNGFSAKPYHRRNGIRGKAVNSLPLLVPAGYYLIQTKGHVCLAYVSNHKELTFPVETWETTTATNQRRILTLHKIINKQN